MSKISNLARSIKTTSQQEAQNITQELRNDFAKTRQSINDFLQQEANTIKDDMRERLERSAIDAVSEATTATNAAAQKIADTINSMQKRINDQISTQETQITQELFEHLKMMESELIKQLNQMERTSTTFEYRMRQAAEEFERRSKEASRVINHAEEATKAADWSVNRGRQLLEQAQKNHEQFYAKINRHIDQANQDAKSTYDQVDRYLQSSAQRLNRHIEETNEAAIKEIGKVNHTIENLSDTMTYKLYQRTYHPIATISWIMILVIVSMFSSCSIRNNYQTSSQLQTKIEQQRAILSDIQKPINAAHASALSNLVTIEQTPQGIKIKSRHPSATKTINDRGLIPSQDDKSLLITR